MDVFYPIDALCRSPCLLVRGSSNLYVFGIYVSLLVGGYIKGQENLLDPEDAVSSQAHTLA